MSQRTSTQRRTWKERALALLLAAVMVAGLVPGLTLPASAEHWADTYLDQLVDWGVLRADQTADPDAALTRADFMAIINRAYGYAEKGPIPFEDVKTTDWFYDDVSIAYTAGYMAGTSDITASPHDTLTREQAVCILGRNMMIKDTPGESLAFADSRDISDWARGTVKTAVDNYIISGYPDNTFQPKAAISKAQMAVLITQCVGTPIQQSGAYELGGVFGNVTITSPNVTLRNTTISGDLYVSGGVGLGGIRLENVNVLGRIIVSGAGESEGGDASVVMRNVTAEEMLVDNMRNKTVTIRADGITEISKTTVRTNAYLEDNNTDDKGLMNIELDGESGTRLTLAGRIKDVVDKTPNSYIQVAKGTVAKLTVDEAAINSTIQLDRNTEVKEMNLDVATNVTGDGDIGQLNVNASGCVVSMLPDKIYIRPGLTANIAGVIMDSQAAEEGSLDPRLLSGYPAAKDITPDGLRADFAGNKKGTVYWAVSNITDGSIDEEALISPPSYGSKAIRNGSVALPTGGEEVSAQITGLTVGGAYYLSAILVDDQGNRSPVKVVSFSTPDNTVPAFGQGYPYMSFVGKEKDMNQLTAQVAVMATKTCKMYYAVLPAGAAAPTTDELRSAAVSGNLGYGVVDLEKNEVWADDRAIIVSRRLEEQKDYVLYLWLTDGVNSSAVTSLAFSTPDVTPPIFLSDPHANGDAQDTSVPLSAMLNENGTIFWVVVESGADYPLPNNQNDKDNAPDGKTALLTSEYAKLQVATGMNAVRSGRVAATANTQVNFSISGLEREKSYDLYYLAQDTAGNYSVQVYKLQGGIRTRDTTPPTVRLVFTKTDSQDATRPMRDTAIILEFSENIRLGGSTQDILALYESTQEGTTSEKEEAQKEFETLLKQNINFYVMNNGRERLAVKGASGVTDKDWAIDFSKATVANVGGKIQITFPSGEDSLRLDSGATYRFEVNTDSQNKITDLSGHEMTPSPVKYDTPESYGHSLPQFTVVFARVDMTSDNFKLDGTQWPAAIAAENKKNQDGNVGIGEYQVDFKFRLMPVDTESAAENIAYDLLLWSDTNIEYDLYYRAVTESGRVLTVQQDVMPNLPAVPDAYGWVLLGNSGVHNIGASSSGRASKRLHNVFNGCTTGGDLLPSLKDLISELDGEEVYYDFAVSVRAVNGRTDPNTWGETVKMYVDVAAGFTESLSNLGASPTVTTWQNFRDMGLGNGGGESIGSADKYESDPRQLVMTRSFTDKVQPVFQPGYPTFDTTEDSVTMNLSLSRPGRVYYVIGYADNTEGVESSNTSSWSPTIGTTVAGGGTIRPEDVPRNGGDRDNANPPMPNLTAPVNTNIQNPSSWPDGYRVVPPGNVACQEVAIQKQTITGLKPNRTYYIYYVITGTDETPSAVEIYKFKTDPVSRPLITIGSTPGTNNQPGRATMTTDMGSELTYKVYRTGSMSSLKYIGDNTLLRTVLDPAYTLPAAYWNLTVYEALMTRYSYSVASNDGQDTNGYFPTDGSGNPEKARQYSVFDVYAQNQVKQDLYDLLEMKDTTTAADSGTAAHLNANATRYSSNVIQSNQSYYVIAMARRDPEDENTANSSIGVRYSFMANEIKISDQNPPDLTTIDGGFTISVNEDGTNPKITSGEIVLIFDKALYGGAGYTTPAPGTLITSVSGTNFFTSTPSGINLTDSTINNATNTASITLQLTKDVAFADGSVSGTVANNKLANGEGVSANALLRITSRIEQAARQDDTYFYDDYIIEVTWTPQANTGLTLQTKTFTVTKTRLKPVTQAAVATYAGGNITTSSGTGNIQSGTLTVNFDKALYTDGTAVNSSNLRQIFDTAEGINLSGSSVVNDTQNDTAQLRLALQPGAKKVSAKISSGAVTNSSGVGTEEDLIITGTEKKTTNSTTGLSVSQYNVDVYWGEEKLNTITGKISR